MQSAKSKAELQQHKNKLASSYSQLLEEFSAPILQHVGNYTLGKIIGTGSFGKVHLARHSLTNGTRVVLKSTSKHDPNLAREIHHHRQFIHPHIARLYEVIVTESHVWLALEFCAGDELYNHLVQNAGKSPEGKTDCGGLEIGKVQRIFTQLVGAVSYIHSKNCVHRDLKLENVLLDKHGNVKLVDFGFTREYEGKSNYLQTFCGTVCYSAPEMLRGEKYAGEKVDVWSLGIILYALLKGELPFDEDDDQATKAIILKDDPNIPDNFPEGAKDLLKKLLAKRPLHRPTLAEVLAHPWLADHAPAQQANLKLAHPAPFTTPLEKATLERMKAAGVDIDKVIENVLSQRCDSLAGWWTLLIEKETKKEARRERKRKEKEAELKILRRLSGASSRLERIAPTLEDVPEEGKKLDDSRTRSTSRGRTNRRNTPQIMVSDLPRLPEGSAMVSPGALTPPAPIDKDWVRRSRSESRPPLPPKERRRRSSNLQIVITNPEGPEPQNRHRRMFGVGKRSDKKFFNQLLAVKHWFVDTTKRATSPSLSRRNNPNGSAKSPTTSTTSSNNTPNKLQKPSPNGPTIHNPPGGHSRQVSGTGSTGTRGSYGATLTPIASNMSNGYPVPGRIEMQRTRQRTSISPSPITPRSSYRRSSQGLRGRKSTSSSVSSIRSMTRYTTHSKASSVSSGSHDASTIHSPSNMGSSNHSYAAARSPHNSLKVLPATPSVNTLPANIRFTRETRNGSIFDESAPLAGSGNNTSVLFARRKKSPFRGPMLNTGVFGRNELSPSAANGIRSPAMFGTGSPSIRPRDNSGGYMSAGLSELSVRRPGRRASARKSMVITEEEDEEEALQEEDEDEEIEEVDNFPPVDVGRGESIHSIFFYDDPPMLRSDVNGSSSQSQPGSAVVSPSEEKRQSDLFEEVNKTGLDSAFESPRISKDLSTQKETANEPMHYDATTSAQT